MPGFSSYDDIISEITTGGKALRYDFFKTGVTMQGAGSWHSMWQAVGTPAAGAAAHAGTPGAALDNFAGSMNWAAVSPDTKHILTLGAVATQNCTLMVYDRLVGVGAIALSGTGSKTVSSAALTRYTGSAAAGNQVWLEVYSTATTVGIVTGTLSSYTDEAGNTGNAASGTLVFPAAATVVGTMVGPFPLLSPDVGVQAVSTINLSVASTAAALANLLIIRPLAYLPLIANQWNERDFVLQLAGLDRVYDTASLAIAVLASSTTALNAWGSLRLGYG
jgi:hypothetical protein